MGLLEIYWWLKTDMQREEIIECICIFKLHEVNLRQISLWLLLSFITKSHLTLQLHGLLGSSVQGISQARILTWVAMPFSGDLSDPGTSPALASGFLTTEPQGKPRDWHEETVEMLVLHWILYSECWGAWTFSPSLGVCRLLLGSSTGTPVCLFLVVRCSLGSYVWGQSQRAQCVFLFVAYRDDKERSPATQLLWSNGVWSLSSCCHHRVSHLQNDYIFCLGSLW